MNKFYVAFSITFCLGVLTVLGFAPFYLFPVPVVTLALLFGFWRKSTTSRQAAWLGFSYGMGMFGAGVSWIYVSLHDFGAMSMPVAVFALFLLCIYLALFPALSGWILVRLRIISPVIWALTAAALWTLSEWLRGSLFTGFPWLALGYSQVPFSPLAGFAPVLGAYGVSFILVLSAAFLLLWLAQGLRTWRYVLPLGMVWLCGFYLQQVDWVQPFEKPVTVSLVQGNIAQDMKWREDHVLNTLETYAGLILESDSRLIVTPEISIPLFYDVVPPAYLEHLAMHAMRNDGDVLVGMIESAPDGSDAYYNTMFSFGSSANQHYRKHHLVPFGEFIPLKPLFGWIIEVLKIPLSDFSRGDLQQQPMHVAGQRVAVNICYEDVFGEEIIGQLPQATLLVNVSNDAWFGRSIGPQQHLQISQMRALETARYMLRATNTGVTAIINERGIVQQEMPVFTTAALHGTAQGFTGATPYVRFGNSLILGLAGLLLLGGFLSVFRASQKTL
ncbi:Apolipoprotein N-acyltransferase [Nitrosomonas cryotolerans]|uniref:Apolipoprotein N-acyltransferase n=1 Tax=Nitrosomonas cryotolerans ATCC 49181 TaxID=1131553 RepID=A0A1N6H5Z5_9PROT|nr:apolipoprotein N-acyltransferase [Nitrosomonas cryotolerans]SFP71705.1 Apolipoprotein N-acyltransferase [Nitrosomonas cryotolerans]SIO15173.1 Apolipoprotein N-acyltransferase [Nitrosomonas cryotolerans ATCC 49181]